MNDSHSDAFVFFGATGDLAHKQIFPALQAMVKHGRLNIPVIGVAKAGWNLDQLRARAHDSLVQHGSLDPDAFAKLRGLLHYVDGDYADPATFQALRKELDGAQRPAHYLAIPPSLFETVVEQLAKSGCAQSARVIVEKPFGHDLRLRPQAQQRPAPILPRKRHLSHRPLSGQAPGEQPGGLPLRQRLHGAVLESQLHRKRADQYGRRTSGWQTRGAFYDQTGAIRDVIENHLFQVLCNLAMEPPARNDSETLRDEKVKVLKSIPPVRPDDLVRGQFRGYRQEKGVDPNSQVETFAAMRLKIDSWRWNGVPFYLRTGKNLPSTCTEAYARFRKPPATVADCALTRNHLRFRFVPEMTIAVGTTVMGETDDKKLETVEMLASRPPRPEEMEAYERLLGDAMAGDQTLFARQDYVEEAWRIVDPVLNAATPAYEYDIGSWGPAEAEKIAPPGGWHNPAESDREDFRVSAE